MTDKIIIYKIYLPALTDLLLQTNALLSADELERGRQFKFVRDQNCYLICRVAMRLLLSHYLTCPANELRFNYNDHGKPMLDQLAFNLSHSGYWAVLAIGGNVDVGVDVEHEDRRSVSLSLVRACFSDKEFSDFQLLAPEQQPTAFFHVWTCKEALIKAIGHGVPFGLANISINVENNEVPALQSIDGDQAESWQLRHFLVATGYHAAVAWRGSPRVLQQCTLASSDTSKWSIL